MVYRWTQKKGIAALLLAVLLLAVGGCDAGSFAEEDEPMGVFLWWGIPLAIDKIDIDPAHITAKKPNDAEQYVFIRMVATDALLPIEVIYYQLETLRLVDEAGESYLACAFMPHDIVFDDVNGVFSTAHQQTAFQALFVIPRDADIASLTLYASIDKEQDTAIGLAPFVNLQEP